MSGGESDNAPSSLWDLERAPQPVSGKREGSSLVVSSTFPQCSRLGVLDPWRGVIWLEGARLGMQGSMGPDPGVWSQG